MAAIAIMAILMVIVFSVYNQTSKAWLLGEQRTETYQNARLVLDMMGRELEGAIAASNTVTGKKITFINVPNANSLPGSPTALTYTQPNDQLFFVGANADSQGQSYNDLTEYGYFVAYAQQNYQTMQSNRYYLVRHMARSNSPAFDVFANPATWPGTSANEYIFSDPSFSNMPILDNVLRLWIMFEGIDTAKTLNGTSICRAWTNAVVSSDLNCSTITPGVSGNSLTPAISNPEITLPRAVHIRLAVIERRSATRLAAYMIAKNWTTGIPSNLLRQVIPNCYGEDLTTIHNTDSVLQNILQDNVRYFYKTVYLRNSPNNNNPIFMP